MTYNGLGLHSSDKTETPYYRSCPTLFENKPKHIHHGPRRYKAVTAITRSISWTPKNALYRHLTVFDNFLQFQTRLHKEVLLVLPYFSQVLLLFHGSEDRKVWQSLPGKAMTPHYIRADIKPSAELLGTDLQWQPHATEIECVEQHSSQERRPCLDGTRFSLVGYQALVSNKRASLLGFPEWKQDPPPTVQSPH